MSGPGPQAGLAGHPWLGRPSEDDAGSRDPEQAVEMRGQGARVDVGDVGAGGGWP